MTIDFLIQDLKKRQILNEKIKKYTLLIDDKLQEQGALFFVPLANNKEVKIVVPAPIHQSFISNESNLTYNNLLKNKDIILLK